MQFLYPIGLLALAGMVIPLIIHVWNIRQGKALKIGSIALLAERAALRSRSYRLTDWLLLFLRLLILILIALLIARPWIVNQQRQKMDNGWILLEKVQFRQVYQQHKDQIDSLLAKGFSLHELKTGFAPLSWKDTLTNREINDTIPVSYYSLIQQLDQEKCKDFKAVIIASQKIAQLGPVKPVINLDLQWIPLQKADTVSTWTRELNTGKYEAISVPSATVYRKLAGKVQDRYVLIEAGNRQSDATYIRAAIQAYASYSKINFRLAAFRPEETDRADLIFWLSAAAIPEELMNKLKRGSKLFSYGGGQSFPIHSVQNFGNQGGNTGPSVRLQQRFKTNRYSGIPMWTDGYGHPLLTRSEQGNFQHYIYYSRFNPEWSELVWSSQFVRQFIPLLITAHGEWDLTTDPRDQRTYNPDFKAQHQSDKPERTLVVSHSPGPEGQETSRVLLQQLLWTILFLLICIERFYAFRKFKMQKYG